VSDIAMSAWASYSPTHNGYKVLDHNQGVLTRHTEAQISFGAQALGYNTPIHAAHEVER
jgi:hypothetical protein